MDDNEVRGEEVRSGPIEDNKVRGEEVSWRSDRRSRGIRAPLGSRSCTDPAFNTSRCHLFHVINTYNYTAM